jgi:hypothetical protein
MTPHRLLGGVWVAIGLLLGGCASPVSVGIPAYPSGGQLEADTRACEQDAAGGEQFGTRRVYMACMIARGDRTYVSIATYWHMAELTVTAARGQSQNQVLRDLEGVRHGHRRGRGGPPLGVGRGRGLGQREATQTRGAGPKRLTVRARR